MPNNTQMTDPEIIELLGGVTAVARMLGIKPPSVHAWLDGGIPEGRLRELAGQIEIKSDGKFTRRARWPDKYAFYWPELAEPQAPAPAQNTPADAAPGAAAGDAASDTWGGVERRDPNAGPMAFPDLERRAEVL